VHDQIWTQRETLPTGRCESGAYGSHCMVYYVLNESFFTSITHYLRFCVSTCLHCLPGWVFMNSKCYYFTFSNTFTRRSWQEARDNCKRQGADLAVIDSMEKQVSTVSSQFLRFEIMKLQLKTTDYK
uniref:C-type lectin domain-containing protein n=1 Tax=Myripristis murdjan TaxID=586833 RepID=A0A667XY64_9TELE